MAEIRIHRSRSLLQAELAIAWVLRGGVALAGALIAIGLFSRIFHLIPVHARSRELIGALLSGQAPESSAVTASALLAGLRSFDPDAVMALGLLFLIALPVVRVAMTVVLFLVERDYVYLVITLFVLLVLLLGLCFGYAL
jgi:uncharacterized membrane protein